MTETTRQVDAASCTAVRALAAGVLPSARAYCFRASGGGRLGRVAAVLRAEGEPVRMPLLAFAVHHPTAGVVLVDTGLHPDAARDLGRDYGQVLVRLFAKLRPTEVGLRGPAARRRRRARRRGARRADPPARRPHQRDAPAAERGVRLLARRVGRRDRPRCGPARLRGGREVLLVGDAAYTIRNVREQLLPAFTADDALSLRSLRELAAYAEEQPDATLVPTHDPTAWQQIR